MLSVNAADVDIIGASAVIEHITITFTHKSLHSINRSIDHSIDKFLEWPSSDATARTTMGVNS